MKAGIVTFWDSNDNYGSLLQNYALQKFLNARKIETFLICAKCGAKNPSLKSRIKSTFRKNGILGVTKKSVFFILGIPKRLYAKRIEQKNAFRKFEEFRNTKLNPTRIYPTIRDLQENPPNADIFITGSDQVWNLFCAGSWVDDFVSLYFLNFASKNARRIACSASICKNELMEGFGERLSTLVRRFDFVSTREKFGPAWCCKIGFKNAFHQADPSFLLSQNEWRTLYEMDKSFLPKQKFALAYILNNDSDFSFSIFKHWAKKNGFFVVYVSGNEMFRKRISLRKKIYATIPQWLELFDNAECVFSNSFHGCVFSIIFNKKFLAVKQKGKTMYSNARVYDLLNEFNLSDRIFLGDFDAVKNQIDWTAVNAKIKKIRKESPFVKYIDDLEKAPALNTGGGGNCHAELGSASRAEWGDEIPCEAAAG